MSAPSPQSDLQGDNWKNVAPAGQQQRPTSLSDRNVGFIQFQEDSFSIPPEKPAIEPPPSVAGPHSVRRAADAGAGSKPPASPAPVAIPLTLRVYEKTIINRTSLATNPIFENKGWHTVSLPYVSILGDTETVIGEVYA